MQIREQLQKLLNSDRITPMITESGLQELRDLRDKVGKKFEGAVTIAKNFYRVKDNLAERSNNVDGKGGKRKMTAADCLFEVRSQGFPNAEQGSVL